MLVHCLFRTFSLGAVLRPFEVIVSLSTVVSMLHVTQVTYACTPLVPVCWCFLLEFSRCVVTLLHSLGCSVTVVLLGLLLLHHFFSSTVF
jgi:hypothetical protein